MAKFVIAVSVPLAVTSGAVNAASKQDVDCLTLAQVNMASLDSCRKIWNQDKRNEGYTHYNIDNKDFGRLLEDAAEKAGAWDMVDKARRYQKD